MAKRPAFQFYPGDWLKDPAVRSVSLAARGLWIDMLCLMHESPRRGYLQLANGKPVTAEQLARMTGCSTDEVSRLLQELEYAGVFSCTEHGVIYSRRMVRDEQKRQKCREAGKRGGNPNLIGARTCDTTLKGQSKGHAKGQSKGDANPNPTPSSSSSFSSSKINTSSSTTYLCGARETGQGADGDLRSQYARLASFWPRGHPRQRRDRRLLARLLVARAMGKSWAAAILDTFLEALESSRKPERPGAYLQALTLRQVPEAERSWFMGLAIPEWVDQEPRGQKPPQGCNALPEPAPPGKEDGIAGMKAVIADCMAALNGRQAAGGGGATVPEVIRGQNVG